MSSDKDESSTGGPVSVSMSVGNSRLTLVAALKYHSNHSQVVSHQFLGNCLLHKVHQIYFYCF